MKKIKVFFLVSAICAVFLFSPLFSTVKAATIEEMQAQIATLVALIAQLQAQLLAMNSTTPVVLAPAITSISPNTAVLGTTVSGTITGTGFSGSTLVIDDGYWNGLTLSSSRQVSNTTIEFTFYSTSSSQYAGAKTIKVRNNNGTSNAVNFTLTATPVTPIPSAPAITALYPTTAILGASITGSITGTGFNAGLGSNCGIVIDDGYYNGLGVSNCYHINDTRIEFTLTANSSTQYAGTKTIKVRTNNGLSNATYIVLNAGTQLPVVPNNPTITSISPSSGVTGETIRATITGSGFSLNPGVYCGLILKDSYGYTLSWSSSLPSVSTCSTVSDSRIDAVFLTSNYYGKATAGDYKVSFKNINGASNSVNLALTAAPVTPTPSAPAITSISPNTAVLGTTVSGTITGTGFSGSTLVIDDGYWNGLTLSSSRQVSNTTIEFTFYSTSSSQYAGAKTIKVRNNNGTSNAVNFTLTATPVTPIPSAPAITALYPTTAILGASITGSITGTGFNAGLGSNCGIVIDDGYYNGLGVSNCYHINDTRIEFTLTANSSTQYAGTKTIKVRTNNGLSNGIGITLTASTLATHKECRNNACISVDGAGADSCTDTASCSSPGQWPSCVELSNGARVYTASGTSYTITNYCGSNGLLNYYYCSGYVPVSMLQYCQNGCSVDHCVQPVSQNTQNSGTAESQLSSIASALANLIAQTKSLLGF